MVTPFPIINAVIEKRQAGALIQFDQSSSMMVSHKFGFSYITDEGVVDLTEMLDLFQSHQELPNYLHLYNPSDAIIKAVSEDKRFNIKLRDRIQLKYLSPEIQVDSSRFSWELVNTINFDDLNIFEMDLSSRFWSSKQDFVDNSAGVIVREDGKIQSICYASALDDSNTAEIDIATLPNARGKGIGKYVASVFVSQCLKKGLVPNWDCFVENVSSLRIAKSVGFTETLSYKFLSVFVKNKE